MIEPFKAEHLRKLQLQPAQSYMTGAVTEEYAAAIEAADGSAFTLKEGGDLILGCGGIVHMWHGRAMLWAMVAGEARGAKFIKVHKAVCRFLAACYVNRLEATVDCDFEEGHRWMNVLGFNMECERMRGYRPDGGDCALYARVLS